MGDTAEKHLPEYLTSGGDLMLMVIALTNLPTQGGKNMTVIVVIAL